MQSPSVSAIFDPAAWRPVDGFSFSDITYHRAAEQGTVRVAFNRPEVRNAFRPHTVDELYRALDHARQTTDVGCVLLTGNGPSPRDGGWAFCSGGDQRIRGRDGYQYASGEGAESVDPGRTGRLHILEVQRLIRFMPKVVICVVPGWAAGGGHSLHVVSRPDHRQRRARPVQADRHRRGQLRRWLRLGLPGPPGRPEVCPGDLLPGPHLRRQGDARHGRGQRGRAPRSSWNGPRWSGPPRSTARARRPSAWSSSPST